MSKVEVDQVTQQSGTTLTVGGGACKTAVVDATTVTLGRCGGTVSLASGATQSGFGRTGTVDWITTPKVTGDSPVTGVTGKGYFLDTTSGTITLNLPAGAAGSIVSMADYARTWDTNNVTVAANGSEKIGSSTEDAVLDVAGQSVTLVYVDSTQGWLNVQDSTSNVTGKTYITATVSGACNTLATAPCCANAKIATFLGPGTFCVSTAANTAANNTVSHLVVAGGGGGGGSTSSGIGGGGAGGYREVKSPSATGYTASPLDGYSCAPNRVTVSATAYPITVGGGGAGSTGPSGAAKCGSTGANSVFSGVTSAGGGGGSSDTACSVSTRDGGSGGGARSSTTAGAGNTPPTTPAQGFAGAVGVCGGPHYTGGGGGGATAAGQAGPGACGGIGGAGTPTTISSAATAYADGAGGGVVTSGGSPATQCGGPGGPGGTGGAGGGPTGPGKQATAGTTNRGGGGGGAGGYPVAVAGAAGGSGIVIIRYKFQ